MSADVSAADVAPPPDVSIVIASWNAKEHLVACLRSIAAEAGALAIETIVVDNASSDDSAATVAREFAWATLVRNTHNLGFARATNIGLAAASGRYLCLMNSDVIVRRGALGTLVRFMDARPTVGLAAPRILNPDGSLQPSCRRFPGLGNGLTYALAGHRLFPGSAWFGGEVMTYWHHDAERSVDAVSGCFCLARREAVAAIGGLDERFFFFSEDVDWCIRFHAGGWDVRFCPDAEAVHWRGASWSVAGERFAVEKRRAQLQLYRKHYGPVTFAYFTALAFVHHSVRLAGMALLYAARPSRRASLQAKIREHAACLRWMTGRGPAPGRIQHSRD